MESDQDYEIRYGRKVSVQHGVTCTKAAHFPREGYLHGEDDDGPYYVDGVTHCGRCHRAITL